jgi:hypothetical protein
MKRLLKKSNTQLKKKAEWEEISPNDPNIMDMITDAIANNQQVQVNYQGSGWRLIEPFGWNTSNDGNVLLMCYKDTGEVRSYRFDKITKVLVDNNLVEDYYDFDINEDGEPESDIPLLPDEENDEMDNQDEDLPFDNGLDYLEDDQFNDFYMNEDENDDDFSEFNDNEMNNDEFNNFDNNENGDDFSEFNDDEMDNEIDDFYENEEK